jgi:hypothetical protein
MDVVEVGRFERIEVTPNPRYALTKTLVKAYLVMPTKVNPHLRAFEVVGRIFPKTLTHNFHVVLKADIQTGTYLGD